LPIKWISTIAHYGTPGRSRTCGQGFDVYQKEGRRCLWPKRASLRNIPWEERQKNFYGKWSQVAPSAFGASLKIWGDIHRADNFRGGTENAG